MTQLTAAADVLIASRDELVAMQLRPPTLAEGSVDTNPLLSDAVSLCIEADIALVALLAAGRPSEPADVIIARYRRRWTGRLIRWGVVGPLAIVALILMGVVIAALVTAFIWRP